MGCSFQLISIKTAAEDRKRFALRMNHSIGSNPTVLAKAPAQTAVCSYKSNTGFTSLSCLLDQLWSEICHPCT